MTTVDEDLHAGVHPGRQRLFLAAAALVTAPGIVLRLAHPHVPHVAAAVLFGAAIIGAAFVLSWAAEVAQLDISAGLAIALLAFIAVLPEYAVDLVFSWKAGHGVQHYGTACRPPGSTGSQRPEWVRRTRERPWPRPARHESHPAGLGHPERY